MPIFRKKQTPVEMEIDSLFRKLKSHTADSKEYEAIIDQISTLHKLQPPPQQVSKDTLVLAGTNLIGIVMILKHEELNVITTKAMSLVTKAR